MHIHTGYCACTIYGDDDDNNDDDDVDNNDSNSNKTTTMTIAIENLFDNKRPIKLGLTHLAVFGKV